VHLVGCTIGSKIYVNMSVGSDANTCEQTEKRLKGLSAWWHFSSRERLEGETK